MFICSICYENIHDLLKVFDIAENKKNVDTMICFKGEKVGAKVGVKVAPFHTGLFPRKHKMCVRSVVQIGTLVLRLFCALCNNVPRLKPSNESIM